MKKQRLTDKQKFYKVYGENNNFYKKKIKGKPKKFSNKLLLNNRKMRVVYYIKRWSFAFTSLLISHGKLKFSQSLVSAIIKKIGKSYNLFNFFLRIEKNMIIYFNMFKKKIAGKNILIPLGIEPHKRINAIIKIILSVLPQRIESQLGNKLYNELIDIYMNKGLSINYRINYIKQLQVNLGNIRYLNEKY